MLFRSCAIYVSFNDFSDVKRWEQASPLDALLRRIAFVLADPAWNESTDKFAEFRATKVEVCQITTWLERLKAQNVPCVLLMDEMNNFPEIMASGSEVARDFAEFLKDNFLRKKGRYFVFSSHVVGTTERLQSYLDYSSESDRKVLTRELPLVPDQIGRAHV